MAGKYDVSAPNRQYNDWDALEGQIVREGTGQDIHELEERVETLETDVEGLTQDITNLNTSVADKVDKEEGKGLVSDTDVTQITTNKNDIEAIQGDIDSIQDEITNINSALGDKVDKETGKELMPEGLDDTVAQHTTDLQALQEAVANIPIIQVSVMPTPSAAYVGKIIQYVGPTSQDLINGYFYQCGYDEGLLVYKWMEKKVMNAAEEGGIDAYTKAETNQLLDNKQDRLTAGEGIKITGNVIMQDVINDTISSPQTTWSSRYLESLFHSLSGLSSIEIVNERPQNPTNNTLYYVKAYEEGEEPLYEIWFFSNNQWTQFGTTAIDLTNYYTKTEVDILLQGKQDTLTPGQGIDITNNNITAKIDGTTLGINDAGNIYVKSGGGGGGGGGFEPTTAQLNAMNSGITQAKREDYDTSLEDVSQLKSDMTQAQSDITDLDTNKADKSDTYTKTEVDTELAKKLDKRTGEGVGVYSHNGETQGEFSVKTTMSDTPLDTNLLTEKGVKTYVDSKDPLKWNYVGILSASSGSTLTIKDDWKELLIVGRITEGSSTYNLVQVIPKEGFTQGSPTGNVVMFGFFWNESYNAKARLGLSGTGDNRKIQIGYSNVAGWSFNGFYIYKR